MTLLEMVEERLVRHVAGRAVGPPPLGRDCAACFRVWPCDARKALSALKVLAEFMVDKTHAWSEREALESARKIMEGEG